MAQLPKTQYAIQLVGPDRLILNTEKAVVMPGRHQILARVEAVGLCFSDLKLLKQFNSHVRKGPIVSGIDPEVLKQIPSYVPGDAPTVPGHEAVVRIEAVGDGVERFRPSRRYLVETDYRWLKTDGSNAAFGYNFEGALQQYVLMDERIITSPDGESMLLPACEELCASQIALVEPWACVEHSYTSKQRRRINADGRMLIVADVPIREELLSGFFGRFGKPAKLTLLSKSASPTITDVPVDVVEDIRRLSDSLFDDIIYLGSDAAMAEALFDRLAARGLFNIVLCGQKFGRAVLTPVGKVHYSAIRIIGTGGFDPAESMRHIPESGEVRAGDKIGIIGAAGPMGMMHTIRNICRPAEGTAVFAADINDKRLAILSKIAAPLARQNAVQFRPYNPNKDKITDTFDYTVLMAPEPDLIAASVGSAAEDAVINVFAGIGAGASTKTNLDEYIAKRLYFLGTSGSVLEDMKVLLRMAEAGRLDANVTIGAICGLAGAVEGIGAIEDRSIPGKIVVYPSCKDLSLVPLDRLKEKIPQVAECLDDGLWTKQAEDRFLQDYQ